MSFNAFMKTMKPLKGASFPSIKMLHVRTAGQGNEKLDPKQHKPTRSTIPCYDPGSMAYMGTMPADSADVVRSHSLMRNEAVASQALSTTANTMTCRSIFKVISGL